MVKKVVSSLKQLHLPKMELLLHLRHTLQALQGDPADLTVSSYALLSLLSTCPKNGPSAAKNKKEGKDKLQFIIRKVVNRAKNKNNSSHYQLLQQEKKNKKEYGVYS